MISTAALGRASLVAALALGGALVGAHAAAAAPTVVATIPGVGAPSGLAVSSDGSRVYVSDFSGFNLYEIDTATNALTRTLTGVSQGATAVTLSASGDVGYILASGYTPGRVVEVDLASGNVLRTIQVGSNPQAMSPSPTGRYLYVSNYGDDSVSIVDTSTWTAQGVSVGSGPAFSGVSADDTVYVPNFAQSTFSVIPPDKSSVVNVNVSTAVSLYQIVPSPSAHVLYATSPTANQFLALDPATGSVLDDTVLPGGYPGGFALSPDGSTAYVNLIAQDSVAVIDTTTMTRIDTIPVGDFPYFSTSSPDGRRVYVANYNSNSVSVISVNGTKTVTFSTNGGSGVMAPQTSDIPTALTANAFTRSGYTFTGWNTDPGGLGTAFANEAVFPFSADDTLYAQWRANPPRPPRPLFPPSAPQDVSGVAGDASAEIAWSPPASTGTFAVTEYQAELTPGGHTCQVAASTTSCTISGLTNGVSYTATVRARSGAGWSPYSTPSDSFIPAAPEPPVAPTITIVGSRMEVRGKPGVVVTGSTTGFDVGTGLKPWIRFPGQAGFTKGVATVLVQQGGEIRWERQTGKRVAVVIKSRDGAVQSNAVVIAAR